MLPNLALFVNCQKGDDSLPFGARLPFWYLRLTHTRLADSILDICGVPSKESIRRACLRILTQFTAPPPSQLCRFLPIKRKRSNSRYAEQNPRDLLASSLQSAAETQGLPQVAATALESFIVNGCMPLPADIADAAEAIKTSLSKLRHSLIENGATDARRLKRFEEAGKCLKHLMNLIQLLYSIGIDPLLGSKVRASVLNRPLYVSLDLGLRQRRHHYHGHVLYQCISLKETYFDDVAGSDIDVETNDTVLSSSGPGLKIAEGGRYDDLVRRYRPPGNFGSAPIPKVSSGTISALAKRSFSCSLSFEFQCAGVRVAVGRLVQLVYDGAASAGNNAIENWLNLDTTKFSVDRQGMDLVRASLGHPLNFAQATVRCVVSGVHGLDAGSCHERFLVASRLWTEGM